MYKSHKNLLGRCLLLLLRIRSVHLVSGPKYSSFLRNLPTNVKVFFAVHDYGKKQTLARAIRIQKENWG